MKSLPLDDDIAAVRLDMTLAVYSTYTAAYAGAKCTELTINREGKAKTTDSDTALCGHPFWCALVVVSHKS